MFKMVKYRGIKHVSCIVFLRMINAYNYIMINMFYNYSPVDLDRSMFRGRGMDDVLWLILILWDVPSRNQLGRKFLRAKTKWPPAISRSNMIFQQMKPGTYVIPHFHVILTAQFVSCIIFMIQGYLQGQKVNFKVKYAKIPFLTNTARDMCNTSFAWDFVWKSIYGITLLIQCYLQGRKSFPRSTIKWPPDISRSNMIF